MLSCVSKYQVLLLFYKNVCMCAGIMVGIEWDGTLGFDKQNIFSDGIEAIEVSIRLQAHFLYNRLDCVL